MSLEREKPRLLVDVTAPDQAPVANAEVQLDGQTVGRTDESGRISLDPRQELPDGMKLQKEAAVTVTPDDPKLAPIEVALVTPTGLAVPNAELMAFGDETISGSATNGAGTLSLEPGTYTVTGRTEDGQVGTTRVTVPVDPAEEATVEVMLDKVEASSDGSILRPVSPILFELGKAELRPDAMAVVKDMARWLIADRTVSLAEIAGHTDDLGGVAYNQVLSEKRAQAVRSALLGLGVPPERLQARGYDLSRPVTKLTDDERRQRNRPVEIRLVSVSTR